MSLSVVSWNVNSVRLRLPLIERLVQQALPDVLCLQETKVRDELFPLLPFHALGYVHAAVWGMKSWNGVAILSRFPLENIQRHQPGGLEDCRHLSASVRGIEIHNLYIPAGGDIPDAAVNPRFAYKLNFLESLSEWFREKRSSADPMILLGDLNIAPLEHDVWDHRKLSRIITHTPTEVSALASLQQSAGWIDSARCFHPEPQKLFTWWSYRQQGDDWRTANRGRRLDHIWMTAPVFAKAVSTESLDECRGWVQPSDHVPVISVISV